MDLKKIGAYIAGKRKERGMTQRELAEKLGMSDKSVSKWERGICLPDVSVYTELCEILGITLNEFLAGEDIDEKDVTTKSERNIIEVTKDGYRRQKKLRKVIAALTAVIILAAAAGGAYGIYSRFITPQNYIEPVVSDSMEARAVEMMNSVTFYRFHTDTRIPPNNRNPLMPPMRKRPHRRYMPYSQRNKSVLKNLPPGLPSHGAS